MMRTTHLLLILLLSIFATDCAATAEGRDAVEPVINTRLDEKYEAQLVDESSYTTDAVLLHREHRPYLLALTRFASEKYGFVIAEKSVGFYFDKRSNDRTSYYLGLDAQLRETTVSRSRDYTGNGRQAVNEDLPLLLEAIRPCGSVLSRPGVQGVVLSLYWDQNGVSSRVNLWIEKRDLFLYYEEKLTLPGLVYRITATDSSGKMFRLTI